ncbi:MAG: hypothetical protein ACI3YD_03965 [Alloprevotella sp.]
MIDGLTVSYTLDGNLGVTLSVETGRDENLPWNLADLFAKIMADSGVNRDMVLDNLKTRLEYE